MFDPGPSLLMDQPTGNRGKRRRPTEAQDEFQKLYHHWAFVDSDR